MSNLLLSVEEVEKIQSRFQNGESAVDLASEHGVSPSTLYRALDEEFEPADDQDADDQDADVQDADDQDADDQDADDQDAEDQDADDQDDGR